MSTLKDVYTKAADLIEKNGLYTGGRFGEKSIHSCEENDCVCIAGAVFVAAKKFGLIDNTYKIAALNPLFFHFDPKRGLGAYTFIWNDEKGTKEEAIAVLKEIAETL
jgi:hypothetical protein